MKNDDGPMTTAMLIAASAMCGFLFGVSYSREHAEADWQYESAAATDDASESRYEHRDLDSGSSYVSWDADLTAFWMGAAAPGTTNYALASTPGDLIFSLNGEALVRLHPDGGAEVRGKPVKTKAAVCDGLQEWIKAEGYGGQR